MTGTLINVGTVLTGGAVGSLVGSRFPSPMRRTLIQAIGLTTLVIGFQRALLANNVLILLGSVALGAVAGELLGIEAKLEQMGDLAQRMLGARPDHTPVPEGEGDSGPSSPAQGEGGADSALSTQHSLAGDSSPPA